MNINSINHASMNASFNADKAKHVENEPQKDQVKNEPIPAVTENSTVNETEDIKNEAVSESDTDVKGVLRNLMDGHYKGVSDVRLRIVFHDEITAIEQEQLQTAAEAEVPVVSDTIASELDNLTQSGELTEDQMAGVTEVQSGFTTAVSQALDDFSGGTISPDSLVGSIRSAFDILTVELGTVLKPAEEETGELQGDIESAETTAALNTFAVELDVEELSEETVEEPVSFDFESYIAELTALFESSINSLSQSLSEVSALPDISEPRGNGVAFDKFMSLYNDLISNKYDDLDTSAFDTIA